MEMHYISRIKILSKKMKLILVLELLTLISSVVCECAHQSMCDECAAYASCYWCESSAKCEDYYGEKFANLLCPNKWVQHKSLCPATDTRMGDILDILKHVKDYQNPQYSSTTSLSKENLEENKSGENNSEELKELLHKLMLLKLLRKLKNDGIGSLNAEDRQMLNRLTSSKLSVVATTASTTTTTAAKSGSGDMSNEIKQLLSILKNQPAGEQTARKPVNKSPEAKTTGLIQPANHTNNSVTNKHTSKNIVKPTESTINLLKKIDEQNAGVIYLEHKTDVISKPTMEKILTNTSLSATKNTSANNQKPTKSFTKVNFCTLYQEIDLCDSDHNCTWCNTRDICIRRSGEDYNSCVVAKDRMKDKEYGLDRCLALKHCKQCVENSKCFWCDVSKSCHTYPFIGYVPPSCGGDWYVKQCDVQLAVIIIVLPLIIILLAMVTFYFCLKYCYYRRKVLRVPLFEKPGVFDYRKDKKVYYVNPEDESSDTEMAAEKIRKKYRLPVEREPLIDPNS